MGKPFVTSVCMVCVLCAIHSHCAAHHNMASGAPVNHTQTQAHTTWHDPEQLNRGLHPHLGPKHVPNTPTSKHKSSGPESQKLSVVDGTEQSETSSQTMRLSRAATERDQQFYIRKLLDKFGDGKSITYEGFKEMLKTRKSMELLDEMLVDHEAVEPSVGSTTNTSRNHTDDSNCLQPSQVFADHSEAGSVQSAALHDMCPSLLYMLTSEQAGCVEAPALRARLEGGPEKQASQWQVWLYASLSILLISLCGLLGVAVIPIMKHMFYQQLLQFFVALAVGTLCGDALLHLLPHAMMASHSHGHDEHHHGEETHDDHGDHDSNMYKGLVAASGVVFLFMTEKCLAVVSEWRQRRQRRRKAPPHVRVMRTTELGVGDASVGEKLCKHKYSSYPYCYDEINTEITDEHQQKNDNHKTENHTSPPTVAVSETGGGGDGSVQFPVHAHGDGEPHTECHHHHDHHHHEHHHHEHHHHDDLGDRMIKVAVGNSDEKMVKITGPPESLTVILREHENTHHGHSHTHGHVHSAPGSMSSVAWMVIMGDGLHNFTDGMAIGAAFAANIAGGFSTAIAVFCHELPHELGDFAVLLKAGMSAKQAVFYNVLSSVLCFFGMIVGVNAGGWDSATQWIFAAAAGMFLYIALVDMIPELTSSHSKEGGACCQCLLQLTGLVAGVGIMFTIAIYEEDLKTVFIDRG